MRALLFPVLLLAAAGCQKQAPSNAQVPDQPAWSGPKADTEAEEILPAPKLDRSHAGTAAPTAEFEDPDGEPVSFAVFQGKPLLVNLWATWCTPCVAEMPTLDALAGRMGGRLQLLALSQDTDGRAKVQAFFSQHRFKTLEPYLDPKMDMMGTLKLDTLPTTILYDAKGREIWRVVGREDWGSARAAALLNEAFSPAKG
ncbi:MAG: TlpA family protein disulfide reductase [Alphaproteobacteria bacterium]|nr:TlpA family protein disulfide reductase [Alphaproteobacteria bacterium]